MKLSRRSFVTNASSAGLIMYAPPLFAYEHGKPYKDFPVTVCFGSRKEFEGELSIVEGSLPNDLYGHVFIMESLNQPEHINLVSSRGAISRIDFDKPGSASIYRRMLDTPSVVAQNALRGTEEEFIQLGKLFFMSTKLGIVNGCNTAFTRLPDGQLAAAYDAGEPYLLDPTTLEVKTPIGGHSEWDSALPAPLEAIVCKDWPFKFVRASAHPKYDDNTGEFISVNFSVGFNSQKWGPLAGKLNLTSWRLSGAFKKWHVVTPNGSPVVIKGAVHTICMTRNHLIVVDAPFGLDILRVLNIPHSSYPQGNFTTLWIIRREDMQQSAEKIVARPVMLAKEWEHLEPNFDDYGGEIVLYGASSPASDFSEMIRDEDVLIDGTKPPKELRGMICAPMDQGEIGCFHIQVEKNGARLLPEKTTFVTNERIGWHIALQAFKNNDRTPEEFTHMYWTSLGYHPQLATKNVFRLYKNYKYRKVPLNELPTEPIPPSLFAVNCRTMEITSEYQAEEGVFISSPQFIPRRGSRDDEDGYILCTAGSDTDGDQLWLFDARDVGKGPICKLAHEDMDTAFSLHTTWMPSMSRYSLDYKISSYDNYNQFVEKKSESIQKMFNEKIYPRFG